jgi:hypothetical protein
VENEESKTYSRSPSDEGLNLPAYRQRKRFSIHPSCGKAQRKNKGEGEGEEEEEEEEEEY